ncbi:hypothetical protein [Acetonema longum]|uniref:Uncharacterized protein n=1 Tax=Acetonema longum DSM 6540 TaxID=1009370 RepID=F7NJ46_9FIRM|nr:hypothetical protein [Acetonema longum]EGO63936.1 hypothetical protein ALO_10509 [Acetonema longum DSM 6540]
MSDSSKVDPFENAKKPNGRSFAGDQDLLEAAVRENKDALMKFEIGVDTFSAADLQQETDNT